MQLGQLQETLLLAEQQKSPNVAIYVGEELPSLKFCFTSVDPKP